MSEDGEDSHETSIHLPTRALRSRGLLHCGVWIHDGGNSWYRRWLATSDGCHPSRQRSNVSDLALSGYRYPDVSTSFRDHADERSCFCELRQPCARQDERLPQPVQLSTAP